MIEPVLVYKDRNETIPYSKIVVPSSMRSPLWKYFGFPADKNNEIITKKKIVCCLCRSYIAYNKNTTNLSTHLSCRHPEYLNNSGKRNKIDQIDESFLNSKRSKVNEISNSDPDPEWCIEDDDSHSQTKDIQHPTGIVTKGHVGKKSQQISNIIEVFISKENKTHSKSAEDQTVQMIDDDYELIISRDEQDNNQLIETLNYSNKDYSEETENNSVVDMTQKNDDFLTEDFLTDIHDIAEPTLYVDKSSQQSSSSEKIEIRNKIFPETEIREIAGDPDVMQQLKMFLIKDLVLPSIVDGDGFKSLMKTLSPNINIPNSSQVQKSLTNDYNLLRSTSKSKLKEVFSQHKFSILFNRLGSSPFQEISICYVNEMENHFFGLERHTICVCSNSDNFLKTITNQLTNCAAFVIDFELNQNSERMISRLANNNGIPIIESFSSVISLALLRCFELESVKEVIIIIEGLMEQNTESCLAKLEYLSNLTDGSQDIPESLSHLMPVIQVLVSCLQPLKNCLDVLAFETTTFSSIMKPIASQLLNQHYRIDEETIVSELETQLKQIITEVLQQKIISNQFLTIASFVDPRFQGLISPVDLKIVRSELEKYIEPTENPSVAKTESKQPQKLKAERNSGLLSLFANHSTIVKPKIPKNRFESEFRSYNEDVSLDMDQCPMTWWLESESLYPNINRQVSKYFCVPAFVNDAHCIPLSSQMRLLAKYSDLDEKANRELIWLHLNDLQKITLNVESNVNTQ